MKIDVIAVLSVCFLHGWPLGHLHIFFFFLLCSFFPFSSFLPLPLFHAHLLSVSSFAVSFSPSRIPCSPFRLSPSFPVSLSFSSPTAILPLSPPSHRGLIYLHCWVKRGVFVCHQQWSHGTMPGVTARVTNLQSLLPSHTRDACVLGINCMWEEGKEFVCKFEYEKVSPCLFPKSVSLYYFFLYVILATLAS